MASSAEVLQQAASLSSGGAPDAKRLRVGAPTASQSEDTEVLSLVERCRRLSLQNQEKAEASSCATNLVVLFKEGADMAKMQEQMALWVAHLPEYKSGAENKKHELGEKRVFLFMCFLQALQDDTSLTSADGTVQKKLSLTSWKSL